MDVLRLADESNLPLVVCRRHPRAAPCALQLVSRSKEVDKVLKHTGFDGNSVMLLTDLDGANKGPAEMDSLGWVQTRDGDRYLHAWIAPEAAADADAEDAEEEEEPAGCVRPVPVLLKRVDSLCTAQQFSAVIVHHDIYLDLCPTAQGVWLWFPQHNSEFMNDAFWEQMGYDPAHHKRYPPHVPGSWGSMIDPDSFKSAIANFEMMVQTEGKVPYDSRVTYQRLDGSSIYLRCQGVPLLWSNDGQVLAMLGSHTDISADNRDRLSKITFIGKISHEIRTPLNAITGCLDIVSDSMFHDEASQEAVEAVQILKTATHQVVDTVNDLILFSTLSAGKLHLNKKSLYIAELLGDVLLMHKISAADKGVKLCLQDLPPAMPETVLADPMRLRQIMSNLLSNAIKFTPAGGSVTVVVNCTAARTSSVYYSIDVVDTGYGIPRTAWESIFEDFKQARTSDQQVGTGLGLAICSMLTSVHGGRIFVKSSSKEAGTTMRVQLETPQTTLIDESKPIAGTSNRGKRRSSTDHLKLGKVLIVDDIRTNVFVLKANIKKNIDPRADFTVAENGKVAVSLAMQQSFDFILMDVHMPVMDGIQAAALISQQQPCASIIGFTADTDERTRELCFSSGMLEVLMKPSPTNILRDTLLSILQKRMEGIAPSTPEV